ncbi:MAG: molecular chaperone TorD family protein [Magnetococcus sp. WYHC-3]
MMSASPGEQALLRGQSAWFLSRFFLERPVSPWLEDMAAGVSAAMASCPEAPDPDFLQMSQVLSRQDREMVALRLGKAFTRLFRGLQEGYGPPPPHESLYRGGRFMDDTTVAVRQFIADAGFSNLCPEAGPQDHMGTELRFLALVSFRESQARDAGLTGEAARMAAMQMEFLDRHLLAWLPEYARRVLPACDEPLYAAAIRLTLSFAQETREELAMEGPTSPPAALPVQGQTGALR